MKSLYDPTARIMKAMRNQTQGVQMLDSAKVRLAAIIGLQVLVVIAFWLFTIILPASVATAKTSVSFSTYIGMESPEFADHVRQGFERGFAEPFQVIRWYAVQLFFSCIVSVIVFTVFVNRGWLPRLYSALVSSFIPFFVSCAWSAIDLRALIHILKIEPAARSSAGLGVGETLTRPLYGLVVSVILLVVFLATTKKMAKTGQGGQN